MKKYLSFLFILFGIVPLYAQNAEDLFSQSELSNALIGFSVKDVKTGKVMMSFNADKSLTPASVLKLLTTSTALDACGPDYRYVTPVGYSGKKENGNIYGKLVIEGQGDASWNSKYFENRNVFEEIILNLKQKGIRRITEGIVIKSSEINECADKKWINEDIANYYGALCRGINIYDNTYEIEFKSGKAGEFTEIKSVSDYVKDLNFINKVTAYNKKTDNAWIFGNSFTSERLLVGNIPQNRESFIIKGALGNTSKVFAEELIKKLKESGIECPSKVEYDIDLQYTELFQISSPELRDIVYHTNMESVNIFAESVGYRLLKEKGENIDFNYDITDFYKKYWGDKGVDCKGLNVEDFCGLSPVNTVTADFMTDILVYMYNQSGCGYSLMRSFPVAGKTGTLKYFGRGTNLDDNLMAKTGSMKGVRSYCGYFEKNGELKTFCLIVNNYTCHNKKLSNFISGLLKNLL